MGLYEGDIESRDGEKQLYGLHTKFKFLRLPFDLRKVGNTCLPSSPPGPAPRPIVYQQAPLPVPAAPVAPVPPDPKLWWIGLLQVFCYQSVGSKSINCNKNSPKSLCLGEIGTLDEREQAIPINYNVPQSHIKMSGTTRNTRDLFKRYPQPSYSDISH